MAKYSDPDDCANRSRNCCKRHSNICRSTYYPLPLVSCPHPFRKNGKIEKPGSGNTAIQCLVPKEFKQSPNHMLMFIYAVKIEGVRSCMACMIEQILIMSVRQRGTGLGVKTAVTIHQQATFSPRCLVRDREAAKVTGACMFYCPYNYSLCRIPAAQINSC